MLTFVKEILPSVNCASNLWRIAEWFLNILIFQPQK